VGRRPPAARRGRVFQNRQLQSYFANLPWYKPDPSFREDALSDLERSNVATILEYESRVGDEKRFIPPG
jgi:hypothetical protein